MAAKILTFQLTANQQMLLSFLAASAGVQLKSVGPDAYGSTIAQLLEDCSPANAAASPVSFHDPMIVMCGLTQQQFDALLDGMKRTGTFTDVLKAVATPDNLRWTAVRLHQALAAERAMFATKQKA